MCVLMAVCFGVSTFSYKCEVHVCLAVPRTIQTCLNSKAGVEECAVNFAIVCSNILLKWACFCGQIRGLQSSWQTDETSFRIYLAAVSQLTTMYMAACAQKRRVPRDLAPLRMQLKSILRKVRTQMMSKLVFCSLSLQCTCVVHGIP